MANNILKTKREDGFTLIEIVIALAVLGIGLFILLEAHFASLNLYIDVENEAIMDLLFTEAIGTAEFEVLSGNEFGGGDFGERYEGYTFNFSATARDPEELPGLFEVNVSIIGPDESRDTTFFLYDGTQIDLQ